MLRVFFQLLTTMHKFFHRNSKSQTGKFIVVLSVTALVLTENYLIKNTDHFQRTA